MEKAIEIKRRAQRCILNGDLDGALSEYEKLVASGDSDPYHSVLLADLLYKKADSAGATQRYLEAVDGYEKAGLYKNGIAVCKKMSRLSLAPASVLQHLAHLHALDGLATESSLYYMQHADLMIRQDHNPEAIHSLTSAFEVCPENVRAMERLAEVHALVGDHEAAARTLLEAAANYERQGQLVDAKQCQRRADQLRPGLRLTPPQEGDASPAEVPPGSAETTVAATTGTTGSEPHEEDIGAVPTAGQDPAPAGLDLPAAPADGSMIDAPALEASSTAPTTAPQGGEPELRIERLNDSASTPSQPGIDAGARAQASESAAAEEGPEGSGLSDISAFLNQAQDRFRRGDRGAASLFLVRAAQAYDRLGRYESAASIYRSLSQSADSSLQVMMLWLKNCQRRDDRHEAARVACDLGDRSLNDGDAAGAREWFERALAFDESNEMALRRLQHVNSSAGEGTVATVAEWIAPASGPGAATSGAEIEHPVEPELREGAAVRAESDPGIIEIAFDHEPSSALDLGALIATFQRGLEEQLASDPQGYYDLGMSYHEMGLLEEAVESFRVAAETPEFLLRSTEMIARCLLDQGHTDEAAEELEGALSHSDLDPSGSLVLRYQLGLTLEVGGQLDRALAQFEQVYASQASYPDVALKIRALRNTLERD